MLIYRVMFSQHLLNKSLTKREIYERGSPVSQRPIGLVEILSRVYIVIFSVFILRFNNSTKIRSYYRDSLAFLSLDVIQSQIDVSRFFAFAFSSVAFHIP
mgnify:CR=1 FL=1